jgi:hypothetical protein
MDPTDPDSDPDPQHCLLILLDDRRIRIRISDKLIRIWIREAQKHMDPRTDPDSDRDPQHRHKTVRISVFLTIFA